MLVLCCLPCLIVATLLDGRRLAAEIEERLSAVIAARQGAVGRPPGLAVLRVGDDPAKAPVGLRANILFALPFPFLFQAFTGDADSLLARLGTAGTLLLAAWLTRDGIRAQNAYDARKVARRPAIPRKILAAALTGVALLGCVALWRTRGPG